MTTLTASEARSNLYRLIDEAASTHTPILITGRRFECRSYFGGGLARDPGDFAPIVHSWHERVHSRGVEYTHRGMREGPRVVKW
jgi:hypothetical protein